MVTSHLTKGHVCAEVVYEEDLIHLVLLERNNTPAIDIPNIHGEDELHLSLRRFKDSITLIASEGLKPLEP
jgi:hypothetical protein